MTIIVIGQPKSCSRLGIRYGTHTVCQAPTSPRMGSNAANMHSAIQAERLDTLWMVSDLTSERFVTLHVGIEFLEDSLPKRATDSIKLQPMTETLATQLYQTRTSVRSVLELASCSTHAGNHTCCRQVCCC